MGHVRYSFSASDYRANHGGQHRKMLIPGVGGKGGFRNGKRQCPEWRGLGQTCSRHRHNKQVATISGAVILAAAGLFAVAAESEG